MSAESQPTLRDLFARGRHYHEGQDFARAEQCYQEIVQRDPKHVPAWYHLGLTCQAQGKLPEAVENFRLVLGLEPEHGDAHTQLGIALGRLGKPQEAVASLREAVRLRPAHAKGHNNLGVALDQLGRRDEALAAWQEAVRLQPDYAEAHFNVAAALATTGRKAEAIAAYQRAINIKPDYAEAYSNLGLLLNEGRQSADAVILLRQAIRLKPQYAEAHNNLALALLDLGRPDEAVASYEQALRLRPTDADLHNNLGTALTAQGRHAEALASYQLCLWLQPDHADAHWHRALALLQQGQFAEGWREYEWRWQRKRARPRRLAQPLWDGAPRPDQTILLYCEQGLGDTLQFVRYARLVKKRMETVILECPKHLLPLLSTCHGPDRLVAEGDPLPAFDVQSPLLSLPALLASPQPMPAEGPYLSADPERMAQWRKELQRYPGLTIGIAWQGNPKHRWDRQRSFPLRHFQELGQLDGVQLISLQKGPGKEQMRDFPAADRLRDLGSRLDPSGGMSDAAALIQGLDLVITCDSALAHLAGALAKPVWVALPQPADWRWLLDRTDSPWYSTLRLFRQKQAGDWEDVFSRITTAVRAWVASSGGCSTVPATVPSARKYAVAGTSEVKNGPHRQGTYVPETARPASMGDLFLEAQTYHQRRELQQAANRYRQVLRGNPRHGPAHFLLGQVLRTWKQRPEATFHFRQALACQPDLVDAQLQLAQVLEEQKQSEEAVAAYRRFLDLRPDHADAHNRLGILLADRHCYDEAIAQFRTVLQLQPDRPGAYHNIAVALSDQDQFADAMMHWNEALRFNPQHAEAHKARGMALLKQGQFAAGWADYEWRWQCKDFTPLPSRQPRWDGSALEGKTILLYGEQGLGDILQFIRYAPHVKARGGTVIVACPELLHPLFRTCAGIDRLVTKKEPWPAHDVLAPLLSLPGLFQTDLATIPGEVPYLHADPARVEAWQRELEVCNVFKVGIFWQGSPTNPNDAQRSFPLSLFEPLAQVPGVQLFSLQSGKGIEQLAEVTGRFAVTDLGNRLTGQFGETAAVMKNLDVVISCDTAGAHLAGALGIPVWVAVPAPSDWRWLLDRDDSPWYPTLRLFRQQRRADWGSIFERLATALHEKVHGPAATG